MKTFVLLVTLALLAVASGVSAANAAVQPGNETQPGLERTAGLTTGAAPVSFTGTWKTLAGGKYKYTVILKQVGSQVTGSYSPGNGKIFDGVVTDHKLAFKWTQDGGNEGNAEFTMNEDGKGFTGTANALKPKEFTVSWNTYSPPAASFAGTWETITDGKDSISLTMVQKGDQVTGLYPGKNGKIEGTVTGTVLRFKWESDGGTGSGRFVMEEGGQGFSGTYNRGDNPDEVDSTWTGKRPVSFAGVWKVVFISASITMNLHQSGNQVTGEIEVDKAGVPNTPIREGVVVGNTLRFKVGRVADDTSDSMEVVMDEGGKSFKGRLGDVFVTGSLLRATLPALFAGAWQASYEGSFLTLILQQGGGRVTGQLKFNSADFGVIKDGIVVGNTLRFTVVRTDPRKALPTDEFLGSGELVMDEGGKSFKGTILGAATSGTFLGH